MIDGANKVFKAPPGMPECYDIYVRSEVIDGVPYNFFEVELDAEERKNLLAGGTLILSQMGPWMGSARLHRQAADAQSVRHAAARGRQE